LAEQFSRAFDPTRELPEVSLGMLAGFACCICPAMTWKNAPFRIQVVCK
jgi:hypothetical protein